MSSRTCSRLINIRSEFVSFYRLHSSNQNVLVSLQVILGPMFSGKSTELVRRLKRFQIARHDCLVIKYSKDQRYDEEKLATHDKQLFPAVSAEKLNDIREQVEKHSVIGIDEGQFVCLRSCLYFKAFIENLVFSHWGIIEPFFHMIPQFPPSADEIIIRVVPGYRLVRSRDGQPSENRDRRSVGR